MLDTIYKIMSIGINLVVFILEDFLNDSREKFHPTQFAQTQHTRSIEYWTIVHFSFFIEFADMNPVSTFVVLKL